MIIYMYHIQRSLPTPFSVWCTCGSYDVFKVTCKQTIERVRQNLGDACTSAIHTYKSTGVHVVTKYEIGESDKLTLRRLGAFGSSPVAIPLVPMTCSFFGYQG